MDTPKQQPVSETAIIDLTYELYCYLSTISVLAYGAKSEISVNAFDIHSIIEPAEAKAKRIWELMKRGK
ncbi:MAG: hypothetical protein GY862_15980 [Gammaproteobacteria bacterium]|nr:hypothetical protein [Gammaproteobacteria bacterium]